MIIQSLLDQDFYKFSMAQVICNNFPNFNAKYRFICRSKGIGWTKQMYERIVEEINMFCTLKFSEGEIEYLKTFSFFKKNFIDEMKHYKPASKYVRVWFDNDINIEIEGPWFQTIFFEVPILAIVNEIYFKCTTSFQSIMESGKKRLQDKITFVKKEMFKFSEFGTRRRYSKEWHEYLVKMLTENLSGNIFTGTSNVYFAMKNRIPAVGTMAHEFIQAGQACDNIDLLDSQKYMFQKWLDTYDGVLGIALTDTLGFKKFLKDFTPYFAKTYDGVRHDSGDPFNWAQNMIEYYHSLNIDPRTKTLVFSDALDFNTASLLWRKYQDKTNVVFGIGTNLTNDFENVTPLQIVIKLVECNGRPVAKISDNPDKTVCGDQNFLIRLRNSI